MATTLMILLVVFIMVVVMADWFVVAANRVNMGDDSPTSIIKCVSDTLLFVTIGLIRIFSLLFLGQMKNHIVFGVQCRK